MAHKRRAPAPLPPLPPTGVLPHERLGALRRERRLSQAQLAALAGIRKATVVDLERGRTQVPNQSTLRSLATVFGMSLDEFRRALGMHGALQSVPPAERTAPEGRRLSPRAEQLAGLFDSLPIGEQELIEHLCGYFHARRSVDMAAEGQVVAS